MCQCAQADVGCASPWMSLWSSAFNCSGHRWGGSLTYGMICLFCVCLACTHQYVLVFMQVFASSSVFGEQIRRRSFQIGDRNPGFLPRALNKTFPFLWFQSPKF